MHEEEPAVEKEPAGHVAQTELLTAPFTIENVPPVHCVHDDAPDDEYVPTGHTRQLKLPLVAE